tara:strand:+ start:1798 stop:2496 length:699 start_codon:yes stop_codon:yes gene_type:complete
MSVVFTYKFKAPVLLDNQLQICWSDDSIMQKDNEISSTTKTVIDSRKPQPKYNDTNNIKQNSMNYVLYEGKVSITFEWTDDDGITEDDLNVYQKYLEDQSETWTWTADFANKTAKAEATYLGENNDWGEFPFKYFLDTSTIKMVAEENNTKLLCIIKSNADTDYTIRQRDIPIGETITIDKPTSSICYVLFSQPVEINGSAFDKYTQKKLTSSSVSAKNTGTIPCKVLQYYR